MALSMHDNNANLPDGSDVAPVRPVRSCRKNRTYSCRIQVRLDGTAWDALCCFATSRQYTISEAVRHLCAAAGDDSLAGGVRTLREIFPPEPRRSLACERRRRVGNLIFFQRPRDIGVLLDERSWSGLSAFRQRHDLTVSKAIRLLCTRTTRCIGATAGTRLSSL